ncbi:MAG: hypothetical protein AUH78_01405 [Gemmatimonadetes bacterium 13_1_40CM_4_69_8]|nr:MAG: hypothetical protein AUH78_01405 [Gemmatimonadetes bacterium 13_1_40CM_4_69_8]
MLRPLRGTPSGVWLAPLLLMLIVPACARRRAFPPPPPPGTPQRAPVPEAIEVVLTVTNHHWLDVVVYIEHDGQRTRVGTVTAGQLGASHQFRLYGAAIGSPEAVRTETLSIQPGQGIEWTLESSLRRSSVAVF